MIQKLIEKLNKKRLKERISSAIVMVVQSDIRMKTL